MPVRKFFICLMIFLLSSRIYSQKNIDVQKLTFNNQSYLKNYINHSTIQKGAILNYIMNAAPNKQRGIKKGDVPYSYSSGK